MAQRFFIAFEAKHFNCGLIQDHLVWVFIREAPAGNQSQTIGVYKVFINPCAVGGDKFVLLFRSPQPTEPFILASWNVGSNGCINYLCIFFDVVFKLNRFILLINKLSTSPTAGARDFITTFWYKLNPSSWFCMKAT